MQDDCLISTATRLVIPVANKASQCKTVRRVLTVPLSYRLRSSKRGSGGAALCILILMPDVPIDPDVLMTAFKTHCNFSIDTGGQHLFVW